MILKDQGGREVRFNTDAIKRRLLKPVKISTEYPNDYAAIYCRDSECYISRIGTKNKFEVSLTYWKSADLESEEIVDTLESKDIDKAITKFLELCKRDPLYEDA